MRHGIGETEEKLRNILEELMETEPAKIINSCTTEIYDVDENPSYIVLNEKLMDIAELYGIGSDKSLYLYVYPVTRQSIKSVECRVELVLEKEHENHREIIASYHMDIVIKIEPKNK